GSVTVVASLCIPPASNMYRGHVHLTATVADTTTGSYGPGVPRHPTIGPLRRCHRAPQPGRRVAGRTRRGGTIRPDVDCHGGGRVHAHPVRPGPPTAARGGRAGRRVGAAAG